MKSFNFKSATNTKEAVKLIAKEIGNQPIVSANGFMSRDLYETNEKSSNFYMIGSMGLASSIGLGIALKNPKRKIHVFDGDGNILMNLGSLVTIGAKKPKNFIHFIFDNNSHESTGSQPTNSNKIDIEKIAMATKFKIFRIKSKIQLKDEIPKIIKKSGPIMVLIEIENGGTKSARVNISTSKIKQRFMTSLKQK